MTISFSALVMQKIDNKTIFDISNLSIIDSYNWFESLEKKLSNFQKEVSNKIIKEINPVDAMKKFVVTMFNLFVSLLATLAIA